MANSSIPLADYFWVAGLDSLSYDDTPLHPITSTQVESTIAEDGELEQEGKNGAAGGLHHSTSQSTVKHSRNGSGGRLSKLSFDPRFSFSNTFDDIDGGNTTASNRSSATIKLSANSTNNNGSSNNKNNRNSSNSNGTTNGGSLALPQIITTDDDLPLPNPALDPAAGSTLDGFDFDKALLKFAAEREIFLDDLSFSAGAKTQAQKPMINPRAERIKAHDEPNGRMSPLRSLQGSIRRRISFREMKSSVRKPPPTSGRQNSVSRTSSIRSKRLSNYNSVIPPPEPLNLDPDMHPLKRRFEPELLDRYPPKDATDDLARRGRFPDYVPMFAFPNDIQVVSSDDRPRSTWHGFTMTSDDNSKLYGITIIIWTAISADLAGEIEAKCERWRQSHMSEEERELAASLGIRLAGERTHLSQLLSKLPTIPSGSLARDRLEDEISTVEEKISLMTDMLRPLRHGAASKIEGLTTGESGLWTPRAYGVLGRDAANISFWKEWLKAIVIPMTEEGVLRVPPTSPRVGRWQPLERYVVNLCTEAFAPLGSKTQVELGVRELRLFARKEAENEIPGSRTVDLYALFRSLSLENVVALFEYAMSESRIIFLSSHTSMLHLACHALASLLYPLKWASIFIPVLPARLMTALEAPCPYVVGIERRYEKIELPEDDYVLVDLDQDTIDATAQPNRLPRQIRRKLMSLLQVAAPHKLRYGVATGPPPYAMESFPYDAFSSENKDLFSSTAPAGTLGKWVAQSSTTYGEPDPPSVLQPPVFNAFAEAVVDSTKSDRPGTSKSSSKTSPESSLSPVSTNFPPLPATPVSRSDSGFALTATLREKRSGHFGPEDKTRRSSSFGVDKMPAIRPNLPFIPGHQANQSVSAVSIDSRSSFGVGYGGGGGGYAPSTYAQSTLAASTIMPAMQVQSVTNTDTTMWVEGHCFNWTGKEPSSAQCHICTERAEGDGVFKCDSCKTISHGRCLGFVSVVCPAAFHADRIRAAFIRCQASLLYNYRKYLGRPSKQQKSNGQHYAFDIDSFLRSLPHDHQEYITMMRETQAFNEFLHIRETTSPSAASVRLFDEVLAAKKARGRPGLSAGLSRLTTIRQAHGASLSAPFPHGSSRSNGSSTSNKAPTYLTDTSDHLWVTATVPFPKGNFPGEYRQVVTRVPSRLDRNLMREPRAIQGVPRKDGRGGRVQRKQVASMLGTTPPT